MGGMTKHKKEQSEMCSTFSVAGANLAPQWKQLVWFALSLSSFLRRLVMLGQHVQPTRAAIAIAANRISRTKLRLYLLLLLPLLVAFPSLRRLSSPL